MTEPRLRDRTSVALLWIGSLLVLGAGMNGLFWFDVESTWRLLVRLAAFLLGIRLIYAHVMTWSRRHVNTLVEPDRPPPAAWKVLVWIARVLW